MVLGLLVLCFHRQIADFVLVREQQLAELLHSRGVKVPVFSQATFHNLYFFLGTAVAVTSMLKLWTGNV